MADSIIRLKVDSQEYEGKLKRATEGLQRYADGCRKVGGTMKVVGKDTLDFVKAVGKMETVSRSATGKLSEMKKTFTELSIQYKQLTEQEKQSPYGKALAQSLDQLKTRITTAKQDLASVNAELGETKTAGIDLNSVLGQLGSKFGISSELMSTLTTGTIAYTAAIGAAATAVAYATKMWAEYNSELAKQQQITSVTTGLKGDDASSMTAGARAISKVYGTDFREVINAANTLMAQFGETGDESLRLLRDGMQGMIQGDGGKLLSMIQQYAPAFRDAGVSASQLIAVIQNSEGGIFTDQNMSAIVMGIKNIRLMTNQTSDALGKLGIDGQKMSQDLSNGTITIFDALKQVAGAIEGVGSGSKAAGEVMQTVFGRQGAMAGTKLGEAIATLNLNLDETKKQTGEIGESLKRLNEKTEEFEKNLMDIAGYDGWDTMSNDIKTGVLMSLNETLESVKQILHQLNGIAGIDLNATGIAKWFTDLATFAYNAINPLTGVVQLLAYIGKVTGGGGGSNSNGNGNQLSPEMQRVYNLADHGTPENSIGDVVVTYTRPNKPKGGSGGGRKGGGKVEQDFDPTSIAAQEKKIQDLTKAWREASAAEREYKKGLLEMAKGELAVMNGSQKPIGDIASGQAVGVGLAGIGGTHYDKKQGKYIEDGLAIDASKIKTPLQVMEEELQKLIELQAQFGGVSEEAWGTYQKQIDTAQKKIVKFKGKDEGEKNEKAWQAAAQAVQSVGSAFSSIEDPSVQAAGTVMQAIASIALGFATASSQANTAGTGWGWIAWLAAGAAAMATTISTIHSLTGYAQGGIVKGNSYSGDNVPAMVGGAGGELVGLNAGEVVLTRAMQSNLAQQLQGSGGGGYMPSHISGEQIYVVLNRYTKRSGKGELVTWR